jgi:hypothetical protein
MRPVAMPAVALALAITLAACGAGDNFSPSVENVSGAYTASSFTVTGTSGTTNLLAAGATVSITLAANETTSGRLFVPGGAEDGSDLDADLSGAWSLKGSKVKFTHAADTFIRDVEFLATESQLTGEGTFGDVTIRLMLTKAA